MKVEFGKAGLGGGLIVDGCFSESKLELVAFGFDVCPSGVEIFFGFLLLGIFWKNGISGNNIINKRQ
jgi:hypothetical protein